LVEGNEGTHTHSPKPTSQPANKIGEVTAFLRENNARLYREPEIASYYSDAKLLTFAEAIALLKYQPVFAGKDILDIGVGAGRTTAFLAPLARSYKGIDYSPAMIAQFKRCFPDVPVVLADMTNLRAFDDASFDFALASNNVLDAIGHEERLLTLQEIHRVLRPDGRLMFSSHNRDVRDLAKGPRLQFSRNPITQFQFVVHWFIALANHARLRNSQTFANDYAIVNDEAHDCSLLHYYIGSEAQRRQLADVGFALLDILDQQGMPVTKGDECTHSRSLLYVARRIPVS
jgi:SAM-dependent methyltransferase